MPPNTWCVHETINTCIWAVPLELRDILICLIAVFCLGLSSGGVWLHEALLSGVGCAGSIQTCFGQSQLSHPFTLEWWASGKGGNTRLRGCAWLASIAFRGIEKCLHSSAFCHPIKHRASAHGLQSNKLNLHLKYTAWLGRHTEECKLQVKISIICRANECVFGQI